MCGGFSQVGKGHVRRRTLASKLAEHVAVLWQKAAAAR